jgi:hypothetical protein
MSERRTAGRALAIDSPSRTLGAAAASRRMPAGLTRGAHGDRPGVDALGARIGQDRDRRQHAVEVGHRLAHALEHHAVDALPGRQLAPHQPDLLDDLPRLEVAAQAEPAGGAERTGQRAPDLRADAHADPRPGARAGCARSRPARRRAPATTSLVNGSSAEA